MPTVLYYQIYIINWEQKFFNLYSIPVLPVVCQISANDSQSLIYTYRLDEGVEGSGGMGLFLIGGQWLKILLQKSKGAS